MATKHPQGSGGPRGDDIPGKYFNRLSGHIVKSYCTRVFICDSCVYFLLLNNVLSFISHGLTHWGHNNMATIS